MKGLLCMTEEFEITQELSEDEIEYIKKMGFEQIIKINEKDKELEDERKLIEIQKVCWNVKKKKFAFE